ncbi:membrane integrity-associated transporter subunit PqiA [Providencia alcalifaciens]|uniref:membrane integrity-associated transporter subunit PqiA n=1 Tax=Providencia alcalifaciens TaxID=126385 RepID=UPI00044E9497|nr:membrane integrity-associated transporter subunit PqiA [Providencia alcalifaciens]EUD08360.1 integral membrane protein, PqiA family [Providencia alcalifaciens R90-1475]CAG9412432.1 Intermembrane transport protein PqiA [Providencia alcalifaciens]CAG9416451.1 Intermembrane transport protein PqiA [Providencia alcalifaciens]CAG9417448.1 Intermembrane transport protein PqiA [Providencia alcalifaciens]CAG9417604.1 Intermembrane transport protein PqiA [Providencia alcalifaciens]
MCSHEPHEHVLCPQCDMMVAVPELEQGSKATCPRCETTLISKWRYPYRQPAAYAFSALIMLTIACLFPFVKMSAAGIENEISMFQIIEIIMGTRYSGLALFFLLFSLIIPAFCMVTIILLGLRVHLHKSIKILITRILFQMKSWCMAEIFLAGVLVSFVKLIAYGEIGIGMSFLPYCAFCMMQVRAFQCLDRHWLWNKIEDAPKINKPLIVGQTGISQNVRLCLVCTAILPADQHECPRCHSYGSVRKKQSLQWTLALLLTSIMLYIPANVLPVMTTNALGSGLPSTIMDGVILLWEDGSFPVAMIIFIASIMVPTLKMIGIAWLCLDSQGFGNRDPHRMHFIYELVEYVGRWSMIDVFVITILTALVQMGQLMNIVPAQGVIFFGVVVILTMFAAMTFDPRLTWDRCNKRDAVKAVEQEGAAG